MSRNIPPELNTSINWQVLKRLDGLSAHSDVAEALTTTLEPLGDVQLFCPDSQQYLYVVASTKGVLFAFAVGMNTMVTSQSIHDFFCSHHVGFPTGDLNPSRSPQKPCSP